MMRVKERSALALRMHQEANHHSLYSPFLMRILRSDEQLIERQPAKLRKTHKDLVARRQLFTPENISTGLSGLYIPFWFSEAFQEVDNQTLFEIGCAHFSIYMFGLLFDDTTDLNQGISEKTMDLAQIYLKDAAKRFYSIVGRENKGFNKEFDEILQRYQRVERKTSERKSKSMGKIDLPTDSDYVDTCGLMKVSGSALANKYGEISTWNESRRGYEEASKGIVFLDDLIDFEQDVINGGRTRPICQVFRLLNIENLPTVSKERAIELKKMLYTSGIAEKNIMRGVHHYQIAGDIFDSQECYSWVAYLDDEMKGALNSVKAIKSFNENPSSQALGSLEEGIKMENIANS